jgi:hypothetical protein
MKTSVHRFCTTSEALGGFSDALSRADWPVKQWEVCGLMFEPDVVTHWELARKGRGVATGQVRIAFSRVTATRVSLNDVERRVDARLKAHVVRASSGSGGKTEARLPIRRRPGRGSGCDRSRRAVHRRTGQLHESGLRLGTEIFVARVQPQRDSSQPDRPPVFSCHSCERLHGRRRP